MAISREMLSTQHDLARRVDVFVCCDHWIDHCACPGPEHCTDLLADIAVLLIVQEMTRTA